MPNIPININVNIDMKLLAQVANTLIEKLSGGIGWTFTHDTPKRHAINTYIQEIENSDLPALTKSALIHLAPQAIKEYCNQYQIVQYAIDNLSVHARPQDVDNEFLSRIMDNGRHVSAPDIQLIWGKILSNECEKPGQTPKALIRILGDLDRTQAEVFSSLANYVVDFIHTDGQIESQPVLLYNHDTSSGKSPLVGIHDGLLTDSKLRDLSSLGLLSFDTSPFPNACIHAGTPTMTIRYFNEEAVIKTTKKMNLFTGRIAFTSAGAALFRALSPTKHADFFDCIKDYWGRHN